MKNFHSGNLAELLKTLSVEAETGLSAEECRRRREQFGPNELVERRGPSMLKILLRQLSTVLMLVLASAAAVSALLGDLTDAGAIAAILLLNAAVGTYQEHKAERAMAALKRLSAPTTRARRGGRLVEISARELVPGDVILLEAGAAVPADARLIESANLRAQEAALTGESTAVEKDAAAELAEETPLGDRVNCVFMGSHVVYGRGAAVVVETGMRTELGRIAEMLSSVEQEPTPLQRRLDELGRVLAAAALALVAAVFLIGLARGEEIRLMFLTAVSLAVAAVPEGLPAVVTIALALGARRMLARNALIRRLPAVETLGSVTVICSDKTGTLTKNEMSVELVAPPGERFPLDAPDEPPARARAILLAGALCNDAELGGDDAEGGVIGDPTEAALVAAAASRGMSKPALEAAAPRRGEAPFDSARKRMATLHVSPSEGVVAETLRDLFGDEPREFVIFAKGAFDSLIAVCARTPDGALDDAVRARLTREHDELAAQGMRVLAAACRPLPAAPESNAPESLERDLTYLGMLALIDPPREEAREAIRSCLAAGIRPVMITGDHAVTARRIAADLGLGNDREPVVGRRLEDLSDEALGRCVAETDVYARVSPEHKLRIVDALQARGEIVAMTGDGVNDAPALKTADIGVAMGVTGSDVSRQAADMVLLDDNFATIVAAVEEGRVIFDNVRKFIKLLLSANSGELWVMLIGPLAGLPLPLLPLQILWMNLITDGPPALALGVEPAEADVMKRPPRKPGETVFSRGVGRDIVWIGLLVGLVSLGVGFWYWKRDLEQWRTVLFTVMTLSQIALALAIRSERGSLFEIGFFSNKAMAGAVALSIALQLAVVYVEPLQEIFRTVALSAIDLAACFGAAGAVFATVEIQKAFRRRRQA